MTPSKPLASASLSRPRHHPLRARVDERGGQQALRQISSPILIGGAAQVHASEMQYVEAAEHHRCFLISRCDFALRF
jgi:hypothetical protein